MQFTKVSATSGAHLILAVILASPSLFAQHIFAQPPPVQPPPAQPVDIASGVNFPQLVHNVADLDRSIKWYTAIKFKLVQPPTPWMVDEALNKLANTPGAETRTAILKVRTADPKLPFTLVLRQFRGISQQNWSKARPELTAIARDPRPRDAAAFLADLGLVPDPALRHVVRFALLEDLDGLVFEGRAAADGFEVPDLSATPKVTPQAVQLQDINANYASFQVSNLEAVYAQAKEGGAITVTSGGIVNYDKGRAVVIRDPYADSFIMLWQPAQ